MPFDFLNQPTGFGFLRDDEDADRPTGFGFLSDEEDDPWWQDYLVEPAQSFASATAGLPGQVVRGLELASHYAPDRAMMRLLSPETVRSQEEETAASAATLSGPFERTAASLAPEDEAKGLMQEIARGVGGAIPQLAGIVGASALGGPAAAMGLGATMIGGQSHQEALARGVDPVTARRKAMLEAVGGGALEGLGGGIVRKLLGPVARAGGEGLNIAKHGFGARAGAGFLGEGGTESAQSLLASGLEVGTGKEMTAAEIGRRALVEGATGGLLGAGAGVAGRIARMTPEEYATERERVKRELTVQRGLPDFAFEAMERQDARFAEKTLAAGYLSTDLDGARRAYLKKHPAIGANELGDQLYRWMTSKPDERPAVPEELVQFLEPMRALQDDVSQQILAEPEFLSADQKAKFEDGFDQYLRRSFQIHDDEFHIERVKGSPEWVDAERYIAEQLMKSREDADPFVRAASPRQGSLSPETARQEAAGVLESILERSRTDTDILDPLGTVFAPGDLGSADLSVLKHRKEIAEPLLKVLGEYTDPSIAFTKSIARATKTLTERQMYREIKDSGIAEGVFFEEQGVEGYATQIFPEDADQQRGVLDAEGKMVPGPLVRGPKGPLAGLYTSKDLSDTLKLAAEQATSNGLQIINGMVKMGLTVLSPQAQARNVVSNTLALVAGGNFFMPALGGGGRRGVFKGTRNLFKAMRYTATGLDITRWDSPAVKKERQEVFLDFVKHGLGGGNVDIGDIKYYLGEFAQRQQAAGGTLAKLMASRVAQFPQKAYQFGDDSFKLAAWWAETERYKWAGLDDAAAKLKAAEVVKATLQNYSRQPNLVRRIKRFPAAGPFVSFPAAVAINAKNQVKQIRDDFKESAHPDPKVRAKLKQIATYRLGSFATALALPGMIAASLNRIFADKEDREEATEEQNAAILEFTPFYSQDSKLAVVSIQEGKSTIIDMTALDYWGSLKRPLYAAMRAGEDDSAIWEAAKAAMDPVTAEEPFVSSIMDVWRNKDIYGSPVRNPISTFSDQAQDVVNHIVYMNMPGALRTGVRIYRGATGWTSPHGGRAYELGTEALAIVGPRALTLDFGRAVEGRGRWFKHAKGLTSKLITKITDSPGKMGDKQMRDQTRIAHHAIKATYQSMLDGIDASTTMGVSEADVRYYLGPDGAKLSSQAIYRKGPSELDLLMAGKEAEWFANFWMQQRLGAINEARAKNAAREIRREQMSQVPSDDRMQEIRQRWIPLDFSNLYQ